MFGPNARTLPESVGVFNRRYFHHRGPAYRALLRTTTARFRELFGLDEAEWSVCIVTGSGTLVNEAVLWSLTPRVRVHRDSGEFTSRLRRLARAHRKLRPNAAYPHYAMVAYETAEARVVEPEWPRGVSYGEGVRFADCVSSFPYYPPPPGTDIWTTVSSKQLGALPVLGLVVVRRSAWRWLATADAAYSYLNLARWAERAEKMEESPHTPAIPLLHDLWGTLQAFDPTALVATIARRRALLEDIAPPGTVIGEGPVFTIHPSACSPGLAERWGLYHTGVGHWQLFLYGGADIEYARFASDWKKEVETGWNPTESLRSAR